MWQPKSVNYAINEACHKPIHSLLPCIRWLQMVILEVHIKLGGLPWTRYVSLATRLYRDARKKGNLSVSPGHYKGSDNFMN